MINEPLKDSFQIRRDNLASDAVYPFIMGYFLGEINIYLFRFEQPDTFKLVEGWVMIFINLIPPVDISSAEKGLMSVPKVLTLMSAGVSSKQSPVRKPVRV